MYAMTMNMSSNEGTNKKNLQGLERMHNKVNKTSYTTVIPELPQHLLSSRTRRNYGMSVNTVLQLISL